MTEPTELLPCPFCGAAAHFEMDEGRWEWVECESCGMQGNRSASLMEDCKPKLTEEWNRRAPQPTQPQAGAVPLTPWMKPGQFFGGRPERAMEIEATDFYGITEAIHQALEMLANHSDAGTDSSPLDPKRSRRLRQALMAAWMLEYPDEAAAHGIKGGQHGTE